MKRTLTAVAAVITTLSLTGTAWAQAKLCDKPRQMTGFKTCANVESAEKEGTFVQYSTDPEKGQVALMKAFTETFPKIKPTYVRLQAGALYAKLLAERNAKSHLADVLVISDIGMIQDFQRRGGLKPYISPEMEAYKPDYKSKPEGFFTWGSILIAGIAYNSNLVKPEDAPKKWEDLTDPKWKDVINVKVSNSGLQMTAWYVLKPILGDAYFQKLGENKPRAFDSYVQQYGRIIDGQDKVIMGAQYSGYVEYKAKGAPIAWVAPETGLATAQQNVGLIADGPNPNASQLFLDWFLSPIGQKVYTEVLFNHSPRDDVAPPPNALALKDMKLLFPKDYDDFEKRRPEFAKEWDKIVGARK